MDWGLQNRINRILKPDTGRTVMLAIDHGYFLGPTSGLEKPWETVAPLLPHADSLMLTRGTLRQCIPPGSNIPIVMRMSGGTSILTELSNEGMTVAVEDAMRLNASAITLSVFVGEEGERTTLLNLAKLIDEGQRYGDPGACRDGRGQVDEPRCAIPGSGLPHLGRDGRAHGQDLLLRGLREDRRRHAGADRHRRRQEDPREGRRSSWPTTPSRPERCGVDMGRNIFQSDCPVGMIKAVRGVVQGGLGVKEAFDLYLEEKG